MLIATTNIKEAAASYKRIKKKTSIPEEKLFSCLENVTAGESKRARNSVESCLLIYDMFFVSLNSWARA